MKCAFFAFCNQITDCEEMLVLLEEFFSDKGWNLLVPANALRVPIDHPMNVNISALKKCDLVIVEIGSNRKEMAMIHEHAVNHNIEVIHIHKKGTKALEALEQYAHLAFQYESPEEVVEWLGEKVEG